MSRIATLPLCLLGLSLGISAPALAQQTIDVGVLRDSDIKVVQKMLYPKAKRMELGAALGMIPFDAFTNTPVFGGTFGYHFNETMASELLLTGGIPFKSNAMEQLESPAYGVAPDAYGFMGSVMADFQWSPIYAKMNWQGRKIIHHDVFVSGGLGLVIEESMLPDQTKAMSPALGLSLGSRLFVGKGYALRFQLRDDLFRQYRTKTADTKAYFLKQNVSFTIGFSKFVGD